jgi:hypothetical protein
MCGNGGMGVGGRLVFVGSLSLMIPHNLGSRRSSLVTTARAVTCEFLRHQDASQYQTSMKVRRPHSFKIRISWIAYSSTHNDNG